jgi:tetratricopeptide (TPR) repeat protein
MADYVLKPELVLSQSGTDDPQEFIRLGIDAARKEDFQRGLIFLAEAYRRLVGKEGMKDAFPAAAFSYYGLCLALHKGRIKEGADFCQVALDLEFYNAENYMNLARVWIAARSRRKAVEALERGLAVDPRSQGLQKLRLSLGVRQKPVIPFLGRDNPLNITLGRMRSGSGKKPAAKPSGRTSR